MNSTETDLDKTHWGHWDNLEDLSQKQYKDILEKALSELSTAEAILIRNKINTADTPQEAIKLFLKLNPNLNLTV